MAHMLSGKSSHSFFAPLSHAQTLEMCQHLEGLIRGLQKETQDLREELSRADREIGSLRSAQGSTTAAVSSLQEGQHKANLATEALRKDAIRSTEKASSMARQLEVHADRAQSHKEQQKLADTGLASLKQEVASLGQQLKDLQTHCENGVGGELVQLRNAMKQAQATIHSTREDLERVKAGGQEDRATLRQECAALARLSDDFARLCTATGATDNRLSETIAQLKGTRHHLAQTNAALVKLNEDHRGLKSHFDVSQEVVKKTTAAVKKLQDTMDVTSAKLANANEQLLAVRAGMLGNKDQIEKAVLRLCGVEDAQERSQQDGSSTQLNLENLKQTVLALKERLRETNALVLPNLQMGVSRARATTPRSGKTSIHGSLQSTSPLSLQSTATSWIQGASP
mmetsp:Transcript_28895/g.82149  ORF Transcript_28895/g.82149 Transcript_28895/m.82149 type:complete len:398 (-) Transcript_28895:176-1369(-)